MPVDVKFNLEWLMRGWLLSLIKGNRLFQGAELGTYKGGTTFFLLDNHSKLILHTVDIFERQPGHKDYDTDRHVFTFTYPWILEKAKNYGNRLTVHKGWTHEIADKIPDASLDFVFIDADHEYESVKKDIIAWRPKIRKGGLLMGHDIHLEGVKKAVQECCGEHAADYDYFSWLEPII
jgi:hypothetical protein